MEHFGVATQVVRHYIILADLHAHTHHYQLQTFFCIMMPCVIGNVVGLITNNILIVLVLHADLLNSYICMSPLFGEKMTFVVGFIG